MSKWGHVNRGVSSNHHPCRGPGAFQAAATGPAAPNPHHRGERSWVSPRQFLTVAACRTDRLLHVLPRSSTDHEQNVGQHAKMAQSPAGCCAGQPAQKSPCCTFKEVARYKLQGCTKKLGVPRTTRTFFKIICLKLHYTHLHILEKLLDRRWTLSLSKECLKLPINFPNVLLSVCSVPA